MTRPSRRAVLGMFGAAAGLLSVGGVAHAETTLDARIGDITGRPEFAGARWGIRFQRLGAHEPVYALNQAERFVPASAVKVFPAGTAFATLGPGHRFRTTVHRTGPVTRGVLRGHLVLVPGGDLLLGPRIQPNGTIALPDPDHTYGIATEPLPGDPLGQLRHFARQVARQGIRRVEGRVLVDGSLFRQAEEPIPQAGQRIQVSPMMVNDNVIDVVVTPGAAAGAPATIRVVSPVRYLDVVNEVTTGNPGRLAYSEVSTNPDGTRTVRLTGGVRLGAPPVVWPYFLPAPGTFAELAFTQALRDEGVTVTGDQLSTMEHRRTRLVEHVSPPLSEAVKVMLKVSSNVHTSYFPYLVGAIAGRDPDTAKATGERCQRTLFERAGLDPDHAVNGAYSPDFFVQFLSHMARQRYFTAYRKAMPIMGRDGSLADLLPDSPAAGHVFAKTGTGGTSSKLHKALAGYVMPPSGPPVVFMTVMDKPVSSPDEAFALSESAGLALGQIVTAVYESLT